MRYFNVERPDRTPEPIHQTDAECREVFVSQSSRGVLLGDKIRSALDKGADLGVRVSVSYDEKDAVDVDILSSPNHDFFDIADEVGRMVEQAAPREDPSPVVE